MKAVEFYVEGAVCESCSRTIKRQAMKVAGVKEIEFDLASGRGRASYDSTKTSTDEIFRSIEEKGYGCYINKRKNSGWIFGAAGLLIVAYFAYYLAGSVQLPEISQGMGYGLLFAVGLLTGLHCVGMCGGFVVSYTARDAQNGIRSHRSHVMYGIGKTISYTVIGAVFGLIGSIIAFTPAMRGGAGILAGLFLVLFGLKMLNIIPLLRKIEFKTPKALARFVGHKSKKHSSPLAIGLLNGLMIACGPLQAIYIMAAGTGSMLEGAKLLFVFALGTLPVMLGFGYFASYVSSKVTARILKASGAIVILLGLAMINNGLELSGSGYDVSSLGKDSAVLGQNIAVRNGGYQEIRMDVTRQGWEPDTFVLKKDVPVRWIINGREINGCNNAIQVPKYGLQFSVKQGEQVIEFTPNEEGTVQWSCWMGMIPGTFIVKEDINLNNPVQVQNELDALPEQPRGSCGGSCGSSTCGAVRGGSCGCGGR